MKKRIISYIFLLLMAELGYSQMMKPSIMVVPSNVWCMENGYMQTDKNNSYPDYRKALYSNTDLINAISKINIQMSDRGFPLENLESVLKSLSASNIREKMITSEENGDNIQESPLDLLYKQAQTDIILQLTWKVNQIGPKNSITFNLQAIDSYTNKQIAGTQGTGKPSFSAEVPVLLEEAIVSHMDIFCNRLLDHFKDIQNNGREISLDIRLFESADITFETEFDDYELTEIITGWIAQETVNHRFSKGPSTSTMLQFKQVRMPITDKNGIPIDAYGFARGLSRFLKKEPFNIPSKVVSVGLGKAIIVLGEK